jgi:hypothetical protein
LSLYGDGQVRRGPAVAGSVVNLASAEGGAAMARMVEVPCPNCLALVPVEINDEPVVDQSGEVRITLVADRFEAWQHDLVCEGRIKD